MAQTLLEQLNSRLEAYLAAEALVLKGQSYQIKDRSLQRASLKDIQAAIVAIRKEIYDLDNAGQPRRRRALSIVMRG